MDPFTPLRLTGWRWSIGFAACYCLAATAAIALMRNTAGFAFVWPSSGVSAAALLLLSRRDQGPYLAAMLIGNFAINLFYGSPVVTALGFAFANLFEGCVVARLAGTRGGGCPALDDPGRAFRFALAAAIAAAGGAVLATPFATGWTELRFTASWFAIDLLGMLIVAPLVVTVLRALHDRSGAKAAGAMQFGQSLLLVTAISLAIFCQTDYPLLFLPMVAVLVATYRHGPTGAVISVAIVAVIAIAATSRGLGPVHLIDGQFERVLFLQFYLLCLLGSAMPLAILLSRTFRRKKALRESIAMLEMAEKLAGVGYWRFDRHASSLIWSEQMWRMHERDSSGSPSLKVILRAIHPEDRRRVLASLTAALRRREPFQYDARLLSPDGGLRHVHCRGEVTVEADEVSSVFGIVHDITERIELVQALEAAHLQAESRAEEAARLAETDPLTGVANRRRALSVLEEEVIRARAKGCALSVIMLDVDHFKSINDIYGHAVGDEVLCALAATGRACVRPLDLFARLGGEEFCAILPGADEAQAIEVAERLRSRVEAMPLAALEKRRSVSVSLGVAVHREGLDAQKLLQAADNALYRAKAEGRNRFMLAA